jgi:hypothetical protein
MSQRPGVKGLRSYGIWLLLLVLPPALLYAFITAYGVIDVSRTGICPAEPTDIPAHACTVKDYLREHVLGVWDLAGMALLATAWALLLVSGFVAYFGWRKATREGKPWGIALAGIGVLGAGGMTACAAMIYGALAVLPVTLTLLLFTSMVLTLPLATRRLSAFRAAGAAVALLLVIFIAGFVLDGYTRH